MKPILLIACIVIITVCAYLIHDNYTLTHRVDRLTQTIDSIGRQQPDSLTIFKQQFKEDSYIRQLDRDTTLIIFFITIVLAAFGLVSFNFFNERVETVKDGFLHDTQLIRDDFVRQTQIISGRFLERTDTVIDSFNSFKIEQEKQHNSYVEKYNFQDHNLDIKFTSISGDISSLFIVLSGEHFKQRLPEAGFQTLLLALRTGLEWYSGTKRTRPNELNFITNSLQHGTNLMLQQMLVFGVDFKVFTFENATLLFKAFITTIEDQDIRSNCVKILDLLPKR